MQKRDIFLAGFFDKKCKLSALYRNDLFNEHKQRLVFYATADEADAHMFYRCFFLFFFCFFFVRHKMRQPFSGTAERIFMKLSPNDTGEYGVSNVVPPPGEC